MFGACGSCEGINNVSFYRTAQIVEPPAHVPGDAESKAAISAARQQLLDARDVTRRVGLPLAVATTILGFMVMFWNSRLMGNRPSARSWLIQSVIIQFILIVVGFFALRPVTHANADLMYELRPRMTSSANPAEVQLAERQVYTLYQRTPQWALYARGLFVAFVLFGLTRKRTTDYLAASAKFLDTEN
jgi:hypothetical protein